MSKKVMLFNSVTKDVQLSSAAVDGVKFQKYLEEGYEPICIVGNVGRVGVASEGYSVAKHIEITKK